MAEGISDIIKGLFKMGLSPFVCLLIITIPWGMKMFLEGTYLVGRGFTRLLSGAK
ncbi:hypothetical protein [Rhizobium halophilum]|uniref:hypothetical protein n=1 Tax=Rhizobium halophilum TaxID=2846852 RepID=UPI001EFD4ABD|nr:hypothetical protein [Rhizobium halophilum]MCF6371252.1 hypothetical protein [Rhizobium halophilum]